MGKYLQGLYRPRNPNKYKGDVNQIIYRSSWELKAMSYFDLHPDIVAWSSEELHIPYICPTDNRVHRYFPDFLIKKKDGQIIMIEVKPKKQTVPPKKGKKKQEQYLAEVMTWGKNTAKWKAAEEYCKKKGWLFMKLTEKELNIGS